LLAGAQSLGVTKVLDGQPVPYTFIELANDRNLVRLGVSVTNLYPLATAEANSSDLALVHVATNNTVVLMKTGESNVQLPIGSPLLDAGTNVVMVVTTSDGKHAENVASVKAWVPVQPLAYRTQSTLLQKAGRPVDNRAVILKQLQETKWLTPFLQNQADKLIKELQEKE